MSVSVLTSEQISILESQGCAAEDWSRVRVAEGFDARRVRNARFLGDVTLGANGGDLDAGGVRAPAGVYNATIANCEIGEGARIASVGSHLANLRIGDGALIENVAEISFTPGATCGAGVEVAALNEGGGREVTLFNGLNAQIAWLQAVCRHNHAFTENLGRLIAAEVARSRADKGLIGAGARVTHCGPIRDVLIGPAARVDGAALLADGTINSEADAPTKVGAGVWAESFILAEGAEIDSAASLSHAFVGQGVRMGRQYSAENSLYFANCEAFQGEGCSLFAGPYTVSHHKSTLMIAGLFSFYNAGSGTNQSNHMYKLGPVHQGVLERGCKTGSSSYLLQEYHVGAFSVVIGKHMTRINTPNLPFSYVLDDHGESVLLPAIELTMVGPFRDEEKWRTRDRRTGQRKRDLLVCEVYSPYTVEKMRRGRAELRGLGASSAPLDTQNVDYHGLRVSVSRVQRGIETYTAAIDRYLHGKLAARLEAGVKQGRQGDDLRALLRPSGQTRDPLAWTDACGLLALRERIAALEADVAAGAVASITQLDERLRAVFDSYAADEWDYVCAAYENEYGTAPVELSRNGLFRSLDVWAKRSAQLGAAIVADAEKEFAAEARISYGLDQDRDAATRDFEAVRGTPASNKVLAKVEAEIGAIRQRAQALKASLTPMSGW